MFSAEQKSLHRALKTKNWKRALTLIDAGVYIRYVDREWSPLCYVLVTMRERNADAEALALKLIQVDRDSADRENPRNGIVPLYAAAQGGFLEIIEALLRAGAYPNRRSEYMKTALFAAVEHLHVDVVEFLVNHRVSIEIPDHNHVTPLMEAVIKESNEIVSVLIRAGARVNARDSHGQTPLFYCMRARYNRDSDPQKEAALVQRVQMLLQAGADVNAEDSSGQTALSFACYNGHVRAVDVLIQHGARVDYGAESKKKLKVSPLSALLSGWEEWSNYARSIGAPWQMGTTWTDLKKRYVDIAKLLLLAGAAGWDERHVWPEEITRLQSMDKGLAAVQRLQKGKNLQDIALSALMKRQKQKHAYAYPVVPRGVVKPWIDTKSVHRHRPRKEELIPANDTGVTETTGLAWAQPKKPSRTPRVAQMPVAAKVPVVKMGRQGKRKT